MNLLTGTVDALLSIEVNGWRLYYRYSDTGAATENFVCWFHLYHLGRNRTASTSSISRNLSRRLLRFGRAGAPVNTFCQHHLHDPVPNFIVVGMTARMFLQA